MTIPAVTLHGIAMQDIVGGQTTWRALLLQWPVTTSRPQIERASVEKGTQSLKFRLEASYLQAEGVHGGGVGSLLRQIGIGRECLAWARVVAGRDNNSVKNVELLPAPQKNPKTPWNQC